MPFPYFGRKVGIANLYPHARFDTIIEPFAGSAGYSLHADHWMRNVILVERDPDIAGLWRWLIDPTTTADIIAGLPDVVKGQPIADASGGHPAIHKLMQLSQMSENHWTKHTVTEWMVRDWPGVRDRLARRVHKVKGFKVIEDDYSKAPDVEATWFIDPPYQKIKWGYRNTRNSLDFGSLGEWCRSRRGQTIVCEESGADWLPFTPLSHRSTLDNTPTTEVWWTNEPVTLFSA